MPWTTDLRCRHCDYLERDHVLDVEELVDAMGAEFDCPNCDREKALGVIPTSLKEREPA